MFRNCLETGHLPLDNIIVVWYYPYIEDSILGDKEKQKMDDGQQFNNEAWVAAPVYTETVYRVWVQMTEGQSVKYHGTDKVAADAAIAKWEVYNERARSIKSPFGPKVVEIHVDVIEPEQPAVEESQEPSEVVESSVEAKVASTETESSEVVEEKNFKVVVTGGLKSGNHWFDILPEAKVFLASQIGQCEQVGVQTKEFGGWTSHRREEGCYWDEYQQYRQDWNAGKFTKAFKRDYANEAAARSGVKHVRSH